jgi:transcriptional regulator with XRE-family HTH domain
VAEGLTEPSEITAEREQIRLAMALGQLVYDRRTELGLSEEDLAVRLRTTAEEVEAIETGGALPLTSELLMRLATALSATFDMRVGPGGSAVTLEGRAA